MTAIKPARYMSDVPQDVTESQRSSAMPLPLYYGYDRPADAPLQQAPQPHQQQQYLRPPPFHVRSQRASPVDPDTSTPVTRHLATNHARKSSQAVDPFVTPFDDEHAARPRPSSNPFVAVAM